MRKSSANNVTGVILAGGKSTRFGADKTEFLIGKRTMMDRAVTTVSSVIPKVIVSGRRGQLVAASVPHVVDTMADGGPLAGLSAAFKATKSEWLFVLACDMPAITGVSIQMLMGFITPDSVAIVPREKSGRLHPLFACYHRSTHALCERLLEIGARSMKQYVESIAETGLILCPTFAEATLLNINRPSDLARLNPTSDTWDSPVDIT